VIEGLAAVAARLLAADPRIIAAYLYGSAARGEPASDLDIALLTREESVDVGDLERIAARLQAEAAPSGPDIDVRFLAGTAPRFRANVIREGRLLYDGDPEARIRFEAQSLGEWLDFKPVWERMRRRMFDRWSHG
jgi:predicted nucleotidyltransferase